MSVRRIGRLPQPSRRGVRNLLQFDFLGRARFAVARRLVERLDVQRFGGPLTALVVVLITAAATTIVEYRTLHAAKSLLADMNVKADDADARVANARLSSERFRNVTLAARKVADMFESGASTASSVAGIANALPDDVALRSIVVAANQADITGVAADLNRIGRTIETIQGSRPARNVALLSIRRNEGGDGALSFSIHISGVK